MNINRSLCSDSFNYIQKLFDIYPQDQNKLVEILTLLGLEVILLECRNLLNKY